MDCKYRIDFLRIKKPAISIALCSIGIAYAYVHTTTTKKLLLRKPLLVSSNLLENRRIVWSFHDIDLIFRLHAHHFYRPICCSVIPSFFATDNMLTHEGSTSMDTFEDFESNAEVMDLEGILDHGGDTVTMHSMEKPNILTDAHDDEEERGAEADEEVEEKDDDEEDDDNENEDEDEEKEDEEEDDDAVMQEVDFEENLRLGTKLELFPERVKGNNDSFVCTTTEPNSSLELDTSCANLEVYAGAANSIQEYVSRDDSGSEFSFEDSVGTLDEDRTMTDGFIDLSEPFDMQLLRSCIENGSFVLDKIEHKDVVVVVGKTGVGKSLFIQGIAGKKIVQVKHKTDISGEVVLSDVFEAENPVGGFDVGHKKVSKTRTINYFEKKNVGKGIIYVDSPGFEDTGGPEVDIGTAVMLSQVAKKARSLRFVVLINYASLLDDRGGAMRSVLKLAHTFVSDFEVDKKSFMFRFTHMDGINGRDSMDNARARLADDLHRILEGTTDQDVAKVLKFMKQSLKKKYMFVDVLHPLYSDFNVIAGFAESKLAGVKSPALAANCGLTVQTQMKLMGQLQSKLQKLRYLLSITSLNEDNIQELKQIRETFKYFKMYIEDTKVQDAADTCECSFMSYITVQRQVVEDELTKAGNTKASFNRTNMLALKNAIDVLVALSDKGEAKAHHFERRFHDVFNASYQTVMKMKNASTSLEEVVLELEKLRTWSLGVEAFVEPYRMACRSIEDKIAMASASSSQFVSSNDDVSINELSVYVDDLCALQNQENFNHRLSLHGIYNTQCSSSIASLKSRLSSLITKWGMISTTLFNQMENVWDTLPPKLHLAIDRVQKLNLLISEFSKSIPDLAERSTCALHNLYQDISVGVQLLCDKFAEKTFRIKDAKKKLLELQTIVGRVSSEPGVSATVKESYQDLVDSLNSELKSISGKIEASARQASMHNGNCEAKQFLELRDLSWCDSFVKNASIESDCERLHILYRNRMEVLMDKIMVLVQELSVAAEGNASVLKSCHEAIFEMKQFEAFESALGNHNPVSMKKKKAFSFLGKYREELMKKTRLWSDGWLAAIKQYNFDEAFNLTAHLDMLLGEINVIEAFKIMPIWKKQAAIAKTMILNVFQVVVKYAEAEFSKPANYESMKDCLECMWKTNGFLRTDIMLPSFHNYQELARIKVSEDAVILEKLLEECVDKSKIEEYFQEFTRAQILDPYTNDEASKRLRPLNLLRQNRDTEADQLLEEMIVNDQFKGMREFLQPLSKSLNFVEKKQYAQHKSRIEKKIEERVSNGRTRAGGQLSCVEDVEALVNVINILSDAGREIGFLFRQCDCNPSKEADSLCRKLKDRFRRHNQDMVQGCNSSDCYIMAKNQHLSSVIFQVAESLLDQKTKQEFQTANSEMKKILEGIAKQVDIFCQSTFQKTGRLELLLPSLKEAVASQNLEFPELKEHYKQAAIDLPQKTAEVLRNVREWVSRTESYDDGIYILEAFHKGQKTWMQNFIYETPFDYVELLDTWKTKRADLERHFSISNRSQDMFHNLKSRLDMLRESGIVGRLVFHTKKTYEKLQSDLDRKGQSELARGKNLLLEEDWIALRKSLDCLTFMKEELSQHLAAAEDRKIDLEDAILKAFLKRCQSSVGLLEAFDCDKPSSVIPFRAVFDALRHYVLHFPFLLDCAEACTEFCLVSQLVYNILKSGVTLLQQAVKRHHYSSARSLVQHNRTDGAFLADAYILLKEELKQRNKLDDEKWLGEISDLCHNHFSAGRDLANIRYCARLGVFPSAPEEEIRRAYRLKAREVHPDMKLSDSDCDNGEEFRLVKEAHDVLTSTRSRELVNDSQPFDSLIKKIPETLIDTVRENLREQKYDQVELLLERLVEFEMVCSLVTPNLDAEKIRSEIIQIVQSNVHGHKVTVDSCWNSRQYKELNHNINDLKQMELHLKSFPDVFPESWNRNIIDKVENEIDSLGRKARGYLEDKASATKHAEEFRRCFVQMGSVMVEIQLFKEYTKSVMMGVLEFSLRSDWGYSYLFELGLSFHKGDESLDEDEKRVAQTLVSEFSHFKEVMTMVWNEETAQKPVEETVDDIDGEQRDATSSSIAIDRASLLQTFHAFDAEYKNLLGTYLKEDADKNRLAKKAIALARTIGPLCCDSGWDDSVKAKLPHLLAAVFALFTILKSGESFARIQKSKDAHRIGEKLLMKPHNVQVLTLLHLLGCGKASMDTSLESKLMQIRTGEGKSIILGAAAAILGLLGFKVRCVCYSEYLSSRDYTLFSEVFDYLDLKEFVKYSKITTLSEDTTATKGDIRGLTERLLRQCLPPAQYKTPAGTHRALLPMPSGKKDQRKPTGSTSADQVTQGGNHSMDQKIPTVQFHREDHIAAKIPGDSVTSVRSQGDTDFLACTFTAVPLSGCRAAPMEEILLVDEVDVFFGPDFYGQTYNKVMELQEPEIAEILSAIWRNHEQGGRKQKLADVKTTTAYGQLLQKMPSFQSLIDNEIRLMLDHVGRVDDERYYLNADEDVIGYKVHDTISYQVTYGYRTVFAYLKEAQAGNLTDKDSTLQRVLNMPIPCGQFSYAAISPSRILGVSGTLDAMSDFEKDVLHTYGVDQFFFVPSVYGQSNFVFDRAGDGIFIEQSKSDYFQKIYEEIQSKTQQRRAVIVFFENGDRLEEFKNSPFYPRLGRQKAVLVENMLAGDKEFIINKAATAGQVTLCTAVFGRGTDFFCQDDRVQDGGGVHIIQAFLSSDRSEEVQIQGRTSRQGKKGSYQLVVLEDDICKKFELSPGAKDSVPVIGRYQWLCEAREKQHGKHWQHVVQDLKVAQSRDAATHEYFDSLIAGDQATATKLFLDLYSAMNKPPIPDVISVDVALLLDATGSMAPYSKTTESTISSLMHGSDSIVGKLKSQFPDTEVKLRFGVLGYRDIDDHGAQFDETVWSGGCHFTETLSDVKSVVDRIVKNPSGGNDMAEDHLGAIDRSLSWNGPSDWSSPIKLVVLFTDAPAHGCVPLAAARTPNVDRYAVAHPQGLTPSSVAGDLATKGINLMVCSYNPYATGPFEQNLAQEYLNHELNSEGREVKSISMVSKAVAQAASSQLIGDFPRHIVFVLDESGSMDGSWSGVVEAFQDYCARRRLNQNEMDLVSVVQFDGNARVTVDQEAISVAASMNLDYAGGDTQFAPAAVQGSQCVVSTPTTHKPTMVFMSDGGTNDAAAAASTLTALNRSVLQKHGSDLDLHVIAFGYGADTTQLQQISRASPKGRVHLSSDTVNLSSIFVGIAGGQQVAAALQEEIGKEISDAVADTLCLGYLS